MFSISSLYFHVTLQVQATSISHASGFNCLPLLSIHFLPPHNPFPLDLLRSCHSPHPKCFSGFLQLFNCNPDFLQGHSAVGSTLLTHGFPLSLQEGEPSANDPIHGAVHIVTLGTYSIFVKQVKEQYPLQRTVRESGLDECQEVMAGEGFHYGMCSRGIKGRP